MNTRTKNLITKFVQEYAPNGFTGFQVRMTRWQDREALGGNHIKELRGKKHTHLALCLDELFNVAVLQSNGQVVHLTSRKEEKAFGISF